MLPILYAITPLHSTCKVNSDNYNIVLAPLFDSDANMCCWLVATTMAIHWNRLVRSEGGMVETHPLIKPITLVDVVLYVLDTRTKA